MKQLTLAMLVAWSMQSFAESYKELALGGLTYHFFTSKQVGSKFNNRISEDGDLIATPLIGFTQGNIVDDEYTSRTWFIAQNSVGKPSGGFVFEAGPVFFKRLQAGIAFGGYLQDDAEFRKRGIAPFAVAEFGTIGLVPVAGLAINYKFPLSQNVYLRLNNILTPVITNHSLGLGLDF